MRILPLLLLLAGCAPQHRAYRLESRTLLPPGVKNAEAQSARLTIPAAKPCRQFDDAGRAETHGRNLRITFTREGLPALDDWAASLEREGCVDSGRHVATQVRESLPVTFSTNSAPADTIELRPGQRLKTVSPIPFGRPVKVESVSGTDSSLTLTVKSDLAGYQIAWWTVEPAGIRFAGAESHVGDKVTAVDHPDFQVRDTPVAKRIRLSYLIRVSASDHNAILIFGDAPGSGDDARQEIPAQVALSVYTRVTANGLSLDVPAPTTVGGVLRTAGLRNPSDALATLAVRRPYRSQLISVEFDRGTPDILSLPLIGGEELSW
jgi:hypothetical protein